MRALEATTKFKRDYKRERKTDPKLPGIFAAAIELLASDSDLPASMRDHSLTGDYKGYRDCHLKPDLVLIYGKGTPGVLKLVRIGSHSELFD